MENSAGNPWILLPQQQSRLGPVTHPGEFFGHKSLIRRVYSRINTERPQSMAIIGGRRCGKTSLLNYLLHHDIQEKYLSDPGNLLFFKVPCAPREGTKRVWKDAGSFIRNLARLLEPDAKPGSDYYRELKKRVEKVHTAGKHIIFCFDDFHHVTQNKEFPLEFFSFLRSLANNYNLAYITTSFLELQKLCVQKHIEESPFFNIFTNISLGLITTEAAWALLRSITRDYDEAVLERIVQWCGPSPFLLKTMAVLLEEEKNALDKPDSYWEKAILSRISFYFEEIISPLSKAAFKPLKSLAKHKNPDPRERYLLYPLLKQGFLLEEQEELLPFAKAFALFLRTKLSKELLKG